MDNTQKVKSVDYLTDFEDISKKMNKPQGLLKGEVIDMDLIKYLPGMLPLAWGSVVYIVGGGMTADPAYKDFQTLDFNIELEILRL